MSMTSVRRGRFITVEGGEGAGKSTQIDVMKRVLAEQGVVVLSTREPGGTPLAEEIRSLLLAPRAEPVTDLAELLLVFAARAQHVEGFIKPALARGDWVLSDRFVDATFAYQGAGRGTNSALIERLREFVIPEFRPDFTLLLDIPVSRGMERVGERGAHDRFEREERSFHERVRDCYLEIASSEPDRVHLIDASLPLTDVSLAVRQAVLGFLARPGVLQ